jgi:hypothetical protein
MNTAGMRKAGNTKLRTVSMKMRWKELGKTYETVKSAAANPAKE